MQKALNQYFCPTWAAELLFERYFGEIKDGCVADPGCGDGRMLLAVPAQLRAFGWEIDPVMAEAARRNSGRPVIAGDFLTVEPLEQPTAFFGSPPFTSRQIDAWLDRCYDLLPDGGKVGFILPCYYLQTASAVMRLAQKWSLEQELIPRNLYQGMEEVILFLELVKEKNRTLTGFFLHAEREAINDMRRDFKRIFFGNDSVPRVWEAAVRTALLKLGGQGSLQEIYAVIEQHKPNTYKFWREKIRQVCREFFECVERGVYRIPEGAS